MSATRSDPDRLLAEVEARQQQALRGKLKIFFGACPGVGKTYAMLQSLHQLQAEGKRVLVGVAETHGRADTAHLLEDLAQLPLRPWDHRGRVLREFDIDAALAARPDLIAVDELAHSNVGGSRHRKRWQDVEELLTAGIDVHSTLNVQHIESLNDIVGRITGVRVRETIPDHVFDQADDVLVVDLPVAELLKRLADGKVYLPDVAESARDRFFREGNLIALRELALRRAADRVDAQMCDYRRARSIEAVWPARERLLLGLSGDGDDERLIRAAAQLARKLDADWTAAYVEVMRHPHGLPARRELARTLALAASLGAETLTLPGEDVPEALTACARSRNVNRLLLGRRPRAPWRFWRRSMADRITRRDPDLDLVVIAQGARQRRFFPRDSAPRPFKWLPYAWASLACFAATALASLLLQVFALANVVMLFLLTVVLVAVRWGRGPGAWAAFLAVACLDFFFVPPRWSMSVSDTQYLFTFGLMLAVALITGQLTARLRHDARIAAVRERRAVTLARLSRELSGALTAQQIVEIALRDFGGGFRAQVGVALPDPADRVRPAAANAIAMDESIAQWVYDHVQPAGAGTATLSAARARYLPLKAPTRARGVLALEFAEAETLDQPEDQRLLEACCSQLALALERVHFVEVARDTLVAIEGERMRNTLLSAVSHDLRTPLTTILGAAQAAHSRLRGQPAAEALVASIGEQAQAMLRLVENLLDLARLQARGVELHRQWQSLEEILGTARHELREPLRAHPVAVDLPADLPLIEVDAALIQRVLVNLLDNAAKHTPAGTPIEIRARHRDGRVTLEISDAGPGLPPIAPEKLFDPFERGRKEPAVGGAGLGLALARRIVEAHGGTIEARPRVPNGAVFAVTLPAPPPPPVESA